MNVDGFDTKDVSHLKDLCREIRSLHFTHRKYEEPWAASVQQYSERRENVYKF